MNQNNSSARAQPMQAQAVPAHVIPPTDSRQPENTLITPQNNVIVKEEKKSLLDQIKWLFSKTKISEHQVILDENWNPKKDEKVNNKIELNQASIYDAKKTQLFILLMVVMVAWILLGWYSLFYFNKTVYANFTKLENAKLTKKEYAKQLGLAKANFEDLENVLKDNQELVLLTPDSIEQDLIQRLYSIGNEIGMDLQKGKNLIVSIKGGEENGVIIENIWTYSTLKKLVKEMWKWRNYYLIKKIGITLKGGETVDDYKYRLELELTPTKKIMFW